MIQLLQKIGYNNVSHIHNEKEENMSSVITFFNSEYAVMGSDGRNINIRTNEINTDKKVKIVQYEDSLIGITGRTDFYFQGRKMEIEDILSIPNTLLPFLNEAHLQSRPQDSTHLTIIKPRYIDYDNKDIHLLELTLIDVFSAKIEVVSNTSQVSVASGVKHCYTDNYIQNLSSNKSDFVQNVKDCINYDIEKGRNAVGGRIEVYEIFADGRINKVQ